MGRIRVLPDAVINQIAAGEVVERPASVVKELLENALDAGGSQITVTLKNGGKDLISVLDDGAGMEEGELRLACQRHATSKIESAADLARIATLGFRGEALASIAAVSRFEIVSCADEAVGGARLSLEGGREREFGKVGFPRGTKVSVEELFYNTPARRKFLRTAATEFQHAQGGFVNLALVHPALRMRLIHNGRTVHQLAPGASLAERAGQLFGRELGEGMIPVAGREGTVSWEGLLGLPSEARASRRWQFLFLNGRPIRHAGLNHAVYQAYRTLLMKERHPAFVLLLQVEPGDVDVNVHPAKTEVRLQNAPFVHTVLADRLHKALLDGSRRIAFGREARLSGRAGGSAGQLALGLGAPSQQVHDVSPGADPLAGEEAAGTPPPGALPAAPAPLSTAQVPAGAESAGMAGEEMARDGTARDALASETLQVNPLDGGGFQFQPVSGLIGDPALPVALADGTAVLGQLAATYLLVQRGDALMIVDQHAAHERILFERYRGQYYGGHMTTERYLLPETLELSAQNALLLEQYLSEWKRMGFEIEPFGKHTYVIREVPALLSGKDVTRLVLEVLDELALFGQSGRLEEVFNEIMERVACHSAVRAGDPLGREEMEALVAQLSGLDINLYCPHGRPVWIEISPRELERRFRRTV